MQKVMQPSRMQGFAMSPSSIGNLRPFAAGLTPRLRHMNKRTHITTIAKAVGKLSVSIGDTSIVFPLPAEEAEKLQAAISGVLATFAEKQKAERPQRWPAMEYKFKGDPASRQLEYFEVFCNPNAHATAFDARALITLRTGDGLKLTTEGKLVGVKAAVDECVQALAGSTA